MRDIDGGEKMKKIIAIILSLVLCVIFFCGCDSDNDYKEDDSWKTKTWDQMDNDEREKTYDYIKDKVEKSWY